MKLLIKHNNCVQPASAYLMVVLTHVLIKDQKPEQPNSAQLYYCIHDGMWQLLGLVNPY